MAAAIAAILSLELQSGGGMQMHIDHLYDLWLSSWLCVKVKFDFLPAAVEYTALAIRFGRVRAAWPFQTSHPRCIEPTWLHFAATKNDVLASRHLLISERLSFQLRFPLLSWSRWVFPLAQPTQL